MQNHIMLARYVRWSYELSLSIYIAFLFMTHTAADIWVEQRLPVPLSRLTRGLFSPDYSFNRQYTAMFLVAGTVFVLLRTLGQIRPLKTSLFQLAGSAMFLAPLFSSAGADRPGWWHWLWLESAASAVAALLYANRRLPAGVAFGAAIVSFHFALWGYVELSDFIHWWEYHTAIEGFVLLPLLTSVSWGFYAWLVARPNSTR